MTERILLAHGDGGVLSHQLITGVFHKYLGNNQLNQLNDAAIVKSEHGSLAITTDSFVVKPVFFPGGNIGKLAVVGTVNDLAVVGAVPKYLTAGFIIEEGMLISQLEEIVKTMAATAHEAGVQVIAGDTKVVERGSADLVYINTTGIGFVPEGRNLAYSRIEAGNVIIINGSIGDHGLTIMSQRAGLEFITSLKSDCAPLNMQIEVLLQEFGDDIKFMRDPTRGGVATTIKEIATASGYDMLLAEDNLPINEVVAGMADMLGLDPLYLANEGKFLMIANKIAAKKIVEKINKFPGCSKAAIIGDVKTGKGNVFLKTAFGGTKILDLLVGEPLPRIC
ncbi:MAG: hydrogenase expression/formation protein HypE [Clostridia bacterium]|nr:hydrogenase expression/formation protein HypE [Clostridia bacterium]